MHLRIGTLALVCGLAASAQGPPAGHFHHLHLNSTDRAAAIAFYTARFDCEKARFAGVQDAVWAQKSWLLFNKVASAPPWELVSAIWHFGWGAEDMKATYQQQLDLGTRFFTALTDISWLAGRSDFYYAYVEGPDHALIELNTASHHRFGHLHLFSEDPVAAGEWYARNFGLIRRSVQKEARFREGVPYAPSVSLVMDNVNILIYPIQYSRKVYPDHWKQGSTPIASTKGRVVDHVAFSVDNLAATLERLRAAGVPITGAFLEGPDAIRIELVEGNP